MRRSVRLHTLPLSSHPPYGLFVDPHAGMHSWFLVDPRVVVGIVSAAGALLALLNTSAH